METSKTTQLIVAVQVKPGSKKGPLIEVLPDKSLHVYVREPAVDGKANIKVQQLLSKHFDVPKTKIQLINGVTSKQKRYIIG